MPAAYAHTQAVARTMPPPAALPSECISTAHPRCRLFCASRMHCIGIQAWAVASSTREYLVSTTYRRVGNCIEYPRFRELLTTNSFVSTEVHGIADGGYASGPPCPLRIMPSESRYTDGPHLGCCGRTNAVGLQRAATVCRLRPFGAVALRCAALRSLGGIDPT